MTPVFTLFLIIFLEGYVVLSTELLAIRLLIPFTGSGTDTVSIIIAAVLMPLAFGYYAGGKFKTQRKNGRRAFTIRRRLVLNLAVAAAILTPGLSYTFISWAFDQQFLYFGWNDRIWLTTIYAALFLICPVFLLGQTVPLISNYFSRERLPALAGRMLFFSTMGSFMGAVFCTLVLMTYVGVHHTVSITITSMAVLTFLLSKKKISIETSAATLCVILSLVINSDAALKYFDIVKNNRYNTIRIVDVDSQNSRLLILNNNYSSGIYRDSDKPYLGYFKYVEENFIEPLDFDPGPPRDILVVGAGGFALGRRDQKNNYTYIDLDGDLQKVSEELFLKEKIGPNKKFEAVEARAFLNLTKKKYDLIVLDVFHGPTRAPEHLVTREFFEQVKSRIKKNGAMVGNYIASPTFSDPFSVKLDNTMRAVFPNLNRQILGQYSIWDRSDAPVNVIYSYVHSPDAAKDIYTDNKNTSLFDKPSELQIR